MNEEWKVIEGYDFAYRVSSLGRVEGTRGLMKPYDNGYGYLIVELKQQGKKKHKRVHRLVAEAFIPNEDNLPMVNHKDEDKTNNFVENLEWCTNNYNINYGTARKRQAKKIRGIPHTDEHKKKISESMKAYREKERAENGYCYNGRGERKDGAD